jgi:cobalt-zinc-cadmium efflux system outer membrane protein
LIPATRGVSFALVLGLWPTTAWAAPLTADDVVRSALARHPDAVASAAAVPAAEARRREVGTFLENPEASVGVAVAGGLFQGTLNQPISLTGEGWYARSAATAGIDAAEGDARRTDLRVAAEARATYAWAVTTRERWQLADEAMRQSTRLREAVEASEAVGEARPLDVRLARMAEAEATELAIRARRDHADALTALSVYAPEAVTAELADDPLAVLPATAATSERSDVAAAEARVREAEAALRRERAATMPHLGVGLFFQKDAAHGDPGDIGPQITVGIPLWTRNQGAIGTARADLDVARAELESIRSRASAEQAVLPEVSTYAEAALGRLGDFERDAREALTSIELGWTTGEIDVSEAVLLRREVLDGWVAALDARQSTVEARLEVLLATEDNHLIPADTAEEDR